MSRAWSRPKWAYIFFILPITGCFQKAGPWAPDPPAPDAPVKSGMVLTPQFTSPTGWKDSSSEPITISISANYAQSFTLRCRTAPVSSISKLSFGDCTSGSEVRPTPTDQNNGSYRTQVQALDGNNKILADQHVDYYVHPSLNGIATCTDAHEDSYYFQQAGALLDQSVKFGNKTSLKPPFVELDLNSPDIGKRMVHNITLRKYFVANQANTLMILKRRYAGQQGLCRISVAGVTTYRNSFSADISDGAPANSMFENDSERDRSSLTAVVYNRHPSRVDQLASDFAKKRNATGGTKWRSYYHQIYNNSSQIHCSAVVFNAAGRAICFASDDDAPIPMVRVNNFPGQLSVMPASVHQQQITGNYTSGAFDLKYSSDAYKKFSSSLTFSPKFRKINEAYYNNKIAAFAQYENWQVGQGNVKNETGPKSIPLLLLED